MVYFQIWFLLPLYTHLGGAMVECMRRWLIAKDMDVNDDSYWTPPRPILKKKAGMKIDKDKSKSKEKITSDKDNPKSREKITSEFEQMLYNDYLRERFEGDSRGPKFVTGWKGGNPLRSEKSNPLYNPNADYEDWREQLTL